MAIGGRHEFQTPERGSRVLVASAEAVTLATAGTATTAVTVVRRALPLVAVVAVSAGLWALRWHEISRHATGGDTFWYAKAAYQHLGETPRQAQRAAARIACAHQQSLGHATCLRRYVGFWYDPRYERIFTSRPIYPLVIAPFLMVFGGGGIVFAGLVVAVGCGLLVYQAVRDLGGSAVAGAAGAALLLALPTGHWCAMLMAEGVMLLGVLAALLGLGWVLHGRWSGLALVSGGLTWSWFAKSSNGVAFAFLLVPLCLLGMAFGRVERRVRQMRLLAVAAAVGLQVAVCFAVSRALGYATFTDSLQDLATRHYQRPNVAHPWGMLLARDQRFWPHYLRTQLSHPGWLVLLVLGMLGIALRSPRAALPWTAAGLSGAVVLAAHPVATEAPRFMVTIWLPVAIGLALLLPPSRRRACGRSGTAVVPGG